jgi:hypothetical protein
MLGDNAVEEPNAALVEAEVADGLRIVAFGLFALEQELPLDALRPLDSGIPLRAHGPRSPEWFSAAASEHASLLDTAPELVALDQRDAGSTSEPLVRADSDIIGIYAPEAPPYLRPVLSVVEPEPELEPVETASGQGHTPRTSVQFGLLRELSDLDA